VRRARLDRPGALSSPERGSPAWRYVRWKPSGCGIDESLDRVALAICHCQVERVVPSFLSFLISRSSCRRRTAEDTDAKFVSI
jgi:hypothetical protein